MSKKSKKKIAVTILREDLSHLGSDQLDLSTQKKALELYCRNKKLKIGDYQYSDEKYVYRSDFQTFLKRIQDKSFRPDVMLFISWEVMAPLLDRFPQTLKILGEKGIEIKSIKKDIIKHALNK